MAKTAAPPSLERYLLQDDEVPGPDPLASPRTDTGQPFDLSEDGAERLWRSGYISTTYQHAEGDRSGGVSSVLLLFETETEAGARDRIAYETSDEVIRDQVFPGATINGSRSPPSPAPPVSPVPTYTAKRSATSIGPRAAA